MSPKLTMLSVIAVLAIVVGVVAGIMLSRPSSPGKVAAPQIQALVKEGPVSTPPAQEPPEVAKPNAVTPSEESAVGHRALQDTAASLEPAKSPANPSPQAKPAKKPKELVDPVARVAMGLVGMDRDAEAYWLEAIYDTSLPDNEREDLMEDLNEDGLSDPKNPGPQDLPLILSRLALIEEIVPHADEFMLRHLGEAYKDLMNLANRSQGGGQLVR